MGPWVDKDSQEVGGGLSVFSRIYMYNASKGVKGTLYNDIHSCLWYFASYYDVKGPSSRKAINSGPCVDCFRMKNGVIYDGVEFFIL
jgi:hypothetical protein